MTDVAPADEEVQEPVEDERTKFIRTYQKVFEWTPPENESDLNESSFDVALAWEALLTLPTCQETLVKESTQKQFNLVVGVNVTQEFPWKQIPYKVLRDLFDEASNGQLLHNAFLGYDLESYVLIGYVPIITQDLEDPPPGDPFVLYANSSDTKLALAIIRNLEIFERLLITKRLLKQPRQWVSLGSEDEVNLIVSKRFHEAVDVEIQSVYPLTIPANKEFSFRLTTDVRDGYVELIPAEGAKFENITRRRITVGIQSSLARINIEQQTDPTFPTNAWAQYLYEINEEDDCLDAESEEEDSKDKTAGKRTEPEVPQLPKPPPEVSDNVKLLLRILELNQIDMYRNDYPHISDKSIIHYTSPYLEETLCFANIAKSHYRYVCGYDWYPASAGIIVTSYTFSTAATIETGINFKSDFVQKQVLEHKPILLWSFNDNLNFKLEFESNLEIVTLSFCPYEARVLLGGAQNGQIILWDLQNRVEKLDVEEMLSPAQMTYRMTMNDFLKWSIVINEDMIVSPSTASRLECSQKGPITSIQWLGTGVSLNKFGKVNTETKENCRFFVSSSMDGTVSFWNLDAPESKKVSSAVRRDLPKALTQNESSYKGKTLVPVFTVAFTEPITGVIADTPVFRCEIKDKNSKAPNQTYNYAIETVEGQVSQIRQSCIASTFYGHIECLSWLGLYADADGREAVHSSVNFARVHDGPIISMKRNPFLRWLFVSIGRTVFAVWKEDYNYSPIFWRKRKCDLTAVAWSESRPSVLFLTRIDGTLEAWDILSRDDDAVLNDTLGGGIVTNICEHKTAEPEKLLGIGDYNSSLRMVKLPFSLYICLMREDEDFEKYILKEEARKKHIQAWEQKYYEKNKEFIEAKLQAEYEAHKEMERIEKEALLQASRKAKEEEEAKRAAQPVIILSYTERTKKQWYELNLNRLLNILMSRKRVNEKLLNEQTVLEKERLAFEAAKKESLSQVLKRVGAEIAALRMRILPEEIPDFQRNDMIKSSVARVMENVESYQDIEAEAKATFEEFVSLDDIDYTEFLSRGQQRRKLLNKSLGGTTERLYWYETALANNAIKDCDWGFDVFSDLFQNPDELSMPQSKTSLFVSNAEDGVEGVEEVEAEDVTYPDDTQGEVE